MRCISPMVYEAIPLDSVCVYWTTLKGLVTVKLKILTFYVVYNKQKLWQKQLNHTPKRCNIFYSCTKQKSTMGKNPKSWKQIHSKSHFDCLECNYDRNYVHLRSYFNLKAVYKSTNAQFGRDIQITPNHPPFCLSK